MKMRHLYLMMTACGFGACAGDEPLYPDLELAPVTNAALDLASGESLAMHLKNGMRLRLRQYGRDPDDGIPPPTPTPISTPIPTPIPNRASASNSPYAAGVDAADIVQYDGEHWYIALQADAQNFQFHRADIQVAKLDSAATDATWIGDLTFDDELTTGEMYWVGDTGARQLAVMRQGAGNIAPRPPAWAGRFGLARDYPDNGEVQLALVDVSEPATPAVRQTITFDGTLLDSRRSGDTLYLVTRFDPWLTALTYDETQASVRQANETTIAEASLEALLPHVKDAGGERLLSESCLLPADRERQHGFAPLLFVSTIDLATGSLQSSVCVSGHMSSLSMFGESLYLAGITDEGNTVLHRFAMAETGVNYAATGEVAGSIANGRSDPASRLDERAGLLHVVSSSRDSGQSPAASSPPPNNTILHRLTVLEQQDNRLVAVATLPNEARPKPIGKPHEQIDSVRFEGDFAYLATFRYTDPLYVIDLSAPLDPKPAGDLEIFGYARSIYPLAGDYLLALSLNPDQFTRIQDMKIELVKMEEGQAQVVDQVLLPRIFASEALTDLHALNVLEVAGDRYRLALPVQERLASDTVYWSEHGLQLLEVDLAGETVQERGRLAGGVYPQREPAGRALLQGDAVFYSIGQAVRAAPFNALDQVINAPALREAATCDRAEPQPSFTLDINSGGTDFESCPSVNVSQRVDSITQNLTLDGQLIAGACVYTGPENQFGLFVADIQYDGYTGVQVPIAVYRDGCDIIPVAEQVTLMVAPTPVPVSTETRPTQ